MDEIKQEASQYVHRGDFLKKSPKAFAIAKKRKILDIVCAHMIPNAGLERRALYAYEYSDRSVYVGLTYNYEKRHAQHKTNSFLVDKRSKCSENYVRFDVWYPMQIAGSKEKDLIEIYRNSGWTILNKNRAGGLGAKVNLWTNERLAEEAGKYKYRNDFRLGSASAYTVAHKRGIIDQICAHMTRKPLISIWTFEKALAMASKYSFRSDFHDHDGGAYAYAFKAGILDEICAHMKYKIVEKKRA